MTRVVLCTGKVFFDLDEERIARKDTTTAIIRLEQLYPIPQEELETALAGYPNCQTLVWCQEEPRNQGSWHRIQNHLSRALRKGQRLQHVSRDASASTRRGVLSETPRGTGNSGKRGAGIAFRFACRHRIRELSKLSVEIKVPMLPESVADATMLHWHVKVGQPVRRDDNLVDIETEKVVLEVPAPRDGRCHHRDSAYRRRYSSGG